MKKMYLTPLAEVVKFEAETMICMSGEILDGDREDGKMPWDD